MGIQINFKSTVDAVEQKNVQKDKTKNNTQVVYVSKNPEAVVNATGVIAGTAGMIGGAVLGGTVGVCKLPGELAATVAGQKYGEIIKNSAKDFKMALKNTPAFADFLKTLNEIKSPEAVEEIIEISETLTKRLNETFKNDPAAKSVIDDVLDPFIKALSLKNNFTSYVSGAIRTGLKEGAEEEAKSGIKTFFKTPAGQTILKVLGFNKKTTKIIGGVTGNAAEGIAEAAMNIRNFTPEQKEAWGRVCNEIIVEFEKNPKIKASTGLVKSLKGMSKDTKWITEPLEALQKNIVEGAQNLNKGLGNAPIKTIGKWSAIGAGVCTVISTLGWAILKKVLIKKETSKAELATMTK